MKSGNHILITETPRDAMQGLTHHIPAGIKAEYISLLLRAGFDTVDCGSFVSPKAIPQMADTSEVISLLDVTGTSTRLMAVVGNVRGGRQAAAEAKLHTIGFPYSVSSAFLEKNINSTPKAAWKIIMDLKELCRQAGKNFRVYVAMAFGNPYGDEWNEDLVIMEVERLRNAGIQDLVFSDITGEGTPHSIESLCAKLVQSFPDCSFGIHLHTRPDDWQDKVEAAWQAGIRNFEGAIGGFGGCPMTGYELLGNLDTVKFIHWCEKRGIETGVDPMLLAKAGSMALKIFRQKEI